MGSTDTNQSHQSHSRTPALQTPERANESDCELTARRAKASATTLKRAWSSLIVAKSDQDQEELHSPSPHRGNESYSSWISDRFEHPAIGLNESFFSLSERVRADMRANWVIVSAPWQQHSH